MYASGCSLPVRARAARQRGDGQSSEHGKKRSVAANEAPPESITCRDRRGARRHRISVPFRMQLRIRLLGATATVQYSGMNRHSTTIMSAMLLMLPHGAMGAPLTVCKRPGGLGETYSVAGDQGVYTWSDHGVERSWTLKCDKQRDGSTACHRWDQYGENGRSVMIFRMLPEGVLIEAGSWALLDVGMVKVTPGFVCTIHDE